jgi:curved DNA-binding protein CbpA
VIKASKEINSYYEILEITPNATHEDVHQAYLKAKNTYSPDSVALYSVFTEKECRDLLDMVETAYSVLSVPTKRMEYDKAHGIVSRFNKPIVTSLSSQKNAKFDSNSLTYNSTNSSAENSDENPRYSQDTGTEFKFSKKEAEVSKLGAQSRFHLEFSKNPEFEQEIENTQEFTGAFLRKIREYKNVSVERMADLIKVSKTYLLQIESCEFKKLPAPAYVRGFVYQYAKCLKLNPDQVANSYLNLMKQEGEK